jgi:hypothetical protein
LSAVGVPRYGDTPETHGDHQLTVRGEPNYQGWFDGEELIDAIAASPRWAKSLQVELRSVLTRSTWGPLTRLPKLFERWSAIKQFDWCVYEANYLTGPLREDYLKECTLPREGVGSFVDFMTTVCGPLEFDLGRPHIRYPLAEPLEPRRAVMPYRVLAAIGKYIFADTDGTVRIEAQSRVAPELFSPILTLGELEDHSGMITRYHQLIDRLERI